MRNNKRLIAAAMALTLVATPVTADAAKLNKNKVTVVSGATTTVKLTNNRKKTKWTTTDRTIKVVNRKKNSITIKALRNGTAVVKVKSGKKTYRCKLRVVGKNANIKMKAGSTLAVEVGRKGKASSSNPNVVKVENKGTVARLCALKRGKTTITAWSPMYYTRFRVTVTGGNTITPEKEEKTEVKVETPEQEVVDNKPTDNYETESSPEMPTVYAKGDVADGIFTYDYEVQLSLDPDSPPMPPIVTGNHWAVRAEYPLGVMESCNGKDYNSFCPMFLSRKMNAKEATYWIKCLNTESVTEIERWINYSDYPQDYKDKLVDVLHQRVELTEEYKHTLDFGQPINGCGHSSWHGSAIYILSTSMVCYGDDWYEYFEEISQTPEWANKWCTIPQNWEDQWGS